jgi:hypothetical protein
LAEANYKIFLDKQKDRDKIYREDLSQDLAMEIIDNSKRVSNGTFSQNSLTKGVMMSNMVDSSKGEGSNHVGQDIVEL